VVSLTTTDGKRYKQKTYNPIGMQLIVFESRQPKAIQYKIAVANLVYAFMKGELSPVQNLKTHNLYLQCKEVLKLAPYHVRPAAIKHLAQKSGKAPQTIYGILNRIEKGATSIDRRGYHRKGKHNYMSDETVKAIERMFIENPRVPVKEVVNKVHGVDCSATTTVYRIRRRIFNKNKGL